MRVRSTDHARDLIKILVHERREVLFARTVGASETWHRNVAEIERDLEAARRLLRNEPVPQAPLSAMDRMKAAAMVVLSLFG